MSAFHHSLIVEEFHRTGGTLTGPQVAAVVGFGWRRDLHDMRKAGYLLVEDAAGLWHLDLEALPDVGRAAVEDLPHADGDALLDGPDACPAGLPAKVDSSSPDTETDPRCEGETPALFEAERQSASPYDPSVEAA